MKNLIYRAAATALPVTSRLGAHSEGIAIIMAHGVYDAAHEGTIPPPRSSVSVSAFKTNILSLRPVYTFVSMDEVVAMLRGGAPWRKRCIALTFDDSLKTHTDVIAPRLVEWGIPATFYLSTETIERHTPYWWLRLEYAIAKAKPGAQIPLRLPDGEVFSLDLRVPALARQSLSARLRSSARPAAITQVVEALEHELGIDPQECAAHYPSATPMTWQDARQLASMGMTVGAHTVNHPNMTLLDDGELHAEIAGCRDTIESKTGLPCKHFCYPHGFYSPKVCAATESLGFRTGVTTESGWTFRNDSPFQLKRFSLPRQEYNLPWTISGVPEIVRRGRKTAQSDPALSS